MGVNVAIHPSRLLCCISLFVVVVSGCECEEPLAELIPDIAVAPVELDLGIVRVGPSSEHAIQVGNRGTGTLELSSVTVEPADFGFTLVSAPRGVSAGDAVDIVVRLDPAVVGTFAADLVIVSNDPDTPRVVVPLRAEGGPARLVVTPDPLDFGVVNEGPGASRTLTLENAGFDILAVRSAGVTVHAEGGFVVDDSALPAVLAPGDRVTVEVTLFPDAVTSTLLDDDDVLRDVIAIAADASDLDLSTGVDVRARINRAPVAIAVEDRTRQPTAKVGLGAPVVIDGSDTVDPEGDAFSFSWSIAERPADSVAVALNSTQPKMRIVPDAVGRYVLQLRATDVHGAFADAFAELLPRDLAVVLTWRPVEGAPCAAEDACDQSDLDLHLTAPGGSVGDYGSCPVDCPAVEFCSEDSDAHVDDCRSVGLDAAFANRSPEWGVPGRSDDPRLDIDDVRGRGPEVTSLNNPADGGYRVSVHYCLDRAVEPTEATIELFDEGRPLGTFGPQRLDNGQLWSAGILQRANGAWTLIPFANVVDTAPAGLCDG